MTELIAFQIYEANLQLDTGKVKKILQENPTDIIYLVHVLPEPEKIIRDALHFGDLELIKLLIGNKCEWYSRDVLDYIETGGNDIFKYLYNVILTASNPPMDQCELYTTCIKECIIKN